jgi:predicted acetyltransferase
MELPQTTSAIEIEVVPASPEQMPIMANLLELYSHDFSEFIELTLGADGRFGYEPLPLYWQDPDRHPFLIRVDGHWAGFAFVRRGSQASGNHDVWDMAEFFIVRGYRRRGVGTGAAEAIWKRFPGKWEVRVMGRNSKAQGFWREAIRKFIGRAVQPALLEREGKNWQVYPFESRQPL